MLNNYLLKEFAYIIYIKTTYNLRFLNLNIKGENKMIGKIENNRRGISKIHPSQYLIKIEDPKYVTSSSVAPLFGKKVVYKTITGKTINGKITGSHGSKGVVKVSFETLLPGTAVGERIEIK